MATLCKLKLKTCRFFLVVAPRITKREKQSSGELATSTDDGAGDPPVLKMDYSEGCHIHAP